MVLSGFLLCVILLCTILDEASLLLEFCEEYWEDISDPSSQFYFFRFSYFGYATYNRIIPFIS